MKLISLIIIFFFNVNVLACDFSTEIKKNSDGSYTYSKDCHIHVGSLVEDNKIKTQQIELLNKSIELKDLVIKRQDDRLKLWMDTTENLESRLSTIERHKSTQNWMYFGLGIALSGLAVYGASQLTK